MCMNAELFLFSYRKLSLKTLNECNSCYTALAMPSQQREKDSVHQLQFDLMG